jgi:DNA-binding SARP family transcriptional activator
VENKELKAPIRINVLGTFSLTYENLVLLEDQGRSRKIWNLLAYLIVNRNKQFSPSELPEILCSEENIEDPAKAVKNLVYRLRCNLTESKMPELNYINQSGGIYSWNMEIPIEVDADIFVQKWKAASKSKLAKDEALRLYLEAIDLYNGKFLPRLEYEEWTVTFSVYYHTIFTECIKQAFKLLSEKEDYLPLIPICKKAIALDPYEEDVYIAYITALTKLNKQKEAFTEYEVIRGKLCNELGVKPSEELAILYKEIIKDIKTLELDLASIKSDLKEKGIIKGTFCTEYEIFKEVYRFIARGVERTGTSVYLMLLTITDNRKKTVTPASLEKSMDTLKETVTSVLRKGDLFAQYSVSQFVVMLQGTSLENGCVVGDRIISAYKKEGTSRNINVQYKLMPLDPSVWGGI